MTLLALLFYVVSAVAWLLDNWKSWVGRWFTIVALVTLVCLGNSWLDAPGFLTLLVIPTALAAGVIGFSAAAAVATGETLLLLLLLSVVPAGEDPATIVAAKAATNGSEPRACDEILAED